MRPRHSSGASTVRPNFRLACFFAAGQGSQDLSGIVDDLADDLAGAFHEKGVDEVPATEKEPEPSEAKLSPDQLKDSLGFMCFCNPTFCGGGGIGAGLLGLQGGAEDQGLEHCRALQVCCRVASPSITSLSSARSSRWWRRPRTTSRRPWSASGSLRTSTA